MSVYNGERYLKGAILSILSQDFTDFEFIIVNDGSTDKTLDIIKEFHENDSRIKIISREKKGLIASLNQGIDIAQGDFIARIDADDIAMPNRFSQQLEFIKENNLSICGTWATKINEVGQKVGVITYPPVDNRIKIFTLFHNPFIHPSVMFKKSVFITIGGYNKNYTHSEDYELWTRFVFKHKAGNIPRELLQYRIHSGQITQKNKLMMRVRGLIVRILSVFRFLIRF
jgi:glycosyltransferase involved in cell wall biosynthesis